MRTTVEQFPTTHSERVSTWLVLVPSFLSSASEFYASDRAIGITPAAKAIAHITTSTIALQRRRRSQQFLAQDARRFSSMAPQLIGCTLQPLVSSKQQARLGSRLSYAAGLTQRMQCRLTYEGIDGPVVLMWSMSTKIIVETHWSAICQCRASSQRTRTQMGDVCV